MLPCRVLLAPGDAAPLGVFLEIDLRPWTKGTRYQATATRGTIVRYERYQDSAIINQNKYETESIYSIDFGDIFMLPNFTQELSLKSFSEKLTICLPAHKQAMEIIGVVISFYGG